MPVMTPPTTPTATKPIPRYPEPSVHRVATIPKPYYVAGRAQTSPASLHVLDKNSGSEAAIVCVPAAEAVDRAIAAAASATEPMRYMAAHKRHDALVHVARKLRERADEIAKVLVTEVGKTISDAKTEVSRAVETFRASAEEATRMHGEYLPLDASSRTENFEAITKRVPIGPASFITPFNFPLNLAAHKVGPAIAVGCPFILKPDPRTPLSSLILGEILAETDLPQGAFSILPVTDAAARDMLVTDERIKLLSFTGSSRVGWGLKATAGKKKVLLELGGCAACIIDAPISKVDFDRVMDRVVQGCFFQAGQSCISTQRILVHSAVHDHVVEAMVAKAKKLRTGDPMHESTQVGPLISVEEAERIEHWIEEAVTAGATLLTGGQRVGAFIDPTLLAGVPPHCRLATEEAFGPVATIEPFDSWDQALERANESRFGLQAGVFTASLSHAFRAWNVLDVGAVIINDSPGARTDTMPYGGVKDSGTGREGVRYAMEEMTELRTLVLRNVGRVRD